MKPSKLSLTTLKAQLVQKSRINSVNFETATIARIEVATARVRAKRTIFWNKVDEAKKALKVPASGVMAGPICKGHPKS